MDYFHWLIPTDDDPGWPNGYFWGLESLSRNACLHFSMTTSSSAAFHNRVPFGTLSRARIRETDPHDDRSRQSLVERCHVSSDSDQRWCKSSACLDIGTESLVALTIQEWGSAAEQYVVRSKVSVVRRFSRGGCFRHVTWRSSVVRGMGTWGHPLHD